MTTKRIKTVIAGLSLAAAVAVIPATALGGGNDEPTLIASPRVGQAEAPTQFASPLRFPGGRTERYEPKARFIVVAEDLYAVDESGADWPAQTTSTPFGRVPTLTPEPRSSTTSTPARPRNSMTTNAASTLYKIETEQTSYS